MSDSSQLTIYPSNTDFNPQAIRAPIGYWTSLLLHCDGSSGSTSFPDASFMTKTTSADGVTVGTSAPKFGTGAALFAGTGAGIAVSKGPKFEDFICTKDFTVDFWCDPTSFTIDGGGNRRLLYLPGMFNVWLETTGPVTIFSTVGAITSTASISGGTYHHIAAVRSGSTLTLYIDGGSPQSMAFSGTFVPSVFNIGAISSTVGRFAGLIDEFRFSKDIARWTSTFTPPSSAYNPD